MSKISWNHPWKSKKASNPFQPKFKVSRKFQIECSNPSLVTPKNFTYGRILLNKSFRLGLSYHCMYMYTTANKSSNYLALFINHYCKSRLPAIMTVIVCKPFINNKVIIAKRAHFFLATIHLLMVFYLFFNAVFE